MWRTRRHLIHTAVSFASFFLAIPLERHLNTALLGTSPTEMMQDYPLHVSVKLKSHTLLSETAPQPPSFRYGVKTPRVQRTRGLSRCIIQMRVA
jgi:hypothetical protein